MLRRWLAMPLKQLDPIRERHKITGYLTDEEELLEMAQEHLKRMGDLERGIARVAAGKISPRETVQLKNSLENLLPLKLRIAQSEERALAKLADAIDPCESLRERIKEVLLEEAPAGIAGGAAPAAADSDYSRRAAAETEVPKEAVTGDDARRLKLELE